MIEGNEPFFLKIAPRLKAGRPLGYDLIVLTSGWQVTQLIENGWVVPLDHGLIPNFARYAATIAKSPHYDPGNRFTIPWQSGFTGIAYNTTKITRPITSVKDLWDPAFRGRVGMMSDNTDLGTAGLLNLGIEPATSTERDWQAAAGVLRSSRGSCATTTTRATSMRSSAVTRGSARPGRATSSRPTRRAIPSSGSSSPTRASCTGPTP